MPERKCDFNSVEERSKGAASCPSFLRSRYRDNDRCERCPKAIMLTDRVFSRRKFSAGEQAALDIRRSQYRA